MKAGKWRCTWGNYFPIKDDERTSFFAFNLLPNIQVIRTKPKEGKAFYDITFTWLFWEINTKNHD